MKSKHFILTTGIVMLILSGCSSSEDILGEEASGDVETALNNDTGDGSLELLTPDITTEDDEIEIQAHDIDEDKITFITIANETVYEDTIENDTVYTFQVSDIDEALSTDYDPKVQLIQTSDDDISGEGDITTFKEERYSVEEE